MTIIGTHPTAESWGHNPATVGPGDIAAAARNAVKTYRTGEVAGNIAQQLDEPLRAIRSTRCNGLINEKRNAA